MSAERLTPATVERLAPYVDRQALTAFRGQDGPPWSWLPRVLRAGAVTLGSDVCFRPGLLDQSTVGGLALIAHECVHVRDYRRLGAPLFLLRYAVGAVQSRFVHDDHPMELEAEALQARLYAELQVS
ncbi:MAG: DUF4157 domain-containing protein [Dehalococcoidia bacterium]